MPDRIFFLCAALIAFHCAANHELTPAQIAKIDIHLQPVLSGGVPSSDKCGTTTDANGTMMLTVIIRGNADDVKTAGIRVQSALGDVLTASITQSQLWRLARIPSVRAVECGSRNVPQRQ
jgi:hypothetical protein